MNLQILPLSQIKVIELEGLAPTLLTGLILSDFGADVIMVNRPDEPALSIPSSKNILNRGKRSVVLNLKSPQHVEILKKMIAGSDVLIDPFRPGVLEKMGLSPEECFKINKRIVICRLTGYGQTGPLALKAGHDLNYLANAAVLGSFGRKEGVPGFPNNILADFMGGGAMAAFGVLVALYERSKTGKGQVVDNSMTESSLYMGSNILNWKRVGLWSKPRGENLYDSGAPFYNVYQTKDQRYLTVGAVDRLSYLKFVKVLDLSEEDERLCIEHQFDNTKWGQIHELFAGAISSKDLAQWTKLTEGMDICLTPVINMEEIPSHTLFQKRKAILPDQHPSEEVVKEFSYQIAPSPKLSNHVGLQESKRIPSTGEHTLEVLLEFQVDKEDIDQLYQKLKLGTPKL